MIGAAHPLARSAALTHPGKLRSINEDNFIADDRRCLWAVADGMGGHAAGDEASRAIVDALNHVRSSWRSARALADDVIGRIEDAHLNIQAESARRGRGRAGATVACLAAFGPHALLAWCGDSRIYRLRGAALERLTRDHTVVQQLVDDGRISEENAETHPQSHVLTRAVGVETALALEFRQLDVQSGDRFLICSDGLSRVAPERDIQALLAGGHNAQPVSEALLACALDAGGPDNITVIVIDFL